MGRREGRGEIVDESRARAAMASAVALALLVVTAVIYQANRSDDVPATDATLSATCTDLHTGHNVMSWDPTMADEMVVQGCGWPYEPFLVSTQGGTEDGALDAAPFGPRLYAELSTLIANSGLGVCAVGGLPDPPADGFVFGFRYALAPPGCAEARPVLDLVAREYASRSLRDVAAHGGADGRVLVLGRWVLTLVPGEGEVADDLSAGIVELGGVDVPTA